MLFGSILADKKLVVVDHRVWCQGAEIPQTALTTNLSWGEHISQKCSQARKKIGYGKEPTLSCVPSTRLLKVTFSLIRSVTSIEAEEAVASSLFGINKNLNVTLE